jgi:hypothetical protein
MKTLALNLLMVVCGAVSAQDYAFKVLINKGQNEIRQGPDWSFLKTGASLKAVDELKVAENGYVGLIHVSGKPLEVKDVGVHKVMDLALRIKASTNVLQKYTDFILSSKTNNSNSMTATGAVHRGTGEIKVFLPKAKHAIVFSDEISIAWARDEATKAYVVRFSSMFGDELDSFEVQDTTLSIDLGKSKFKNEDNIVVNIASKDDSQVSSDNFILKKLSSGDKKRLSASMAEMSALNREESALHMLYLASFYEENALLIDASTAYQQAIRLAPDVPYYQEAFGKFVVRNSLKN